MPAKTATPRHSDDMTEKRAPSDEMAEKRPDSDPSSSSTDIEIRSPPDLENQAEAPADDPVQRNIHGVFWLMVTLSIYSSTFLFALDNTIVANIQPAIVDSLNGLDKLAWSGVAFVMASSATVLTWLQIFSQFNIKWLYITAFVIFQAGSAVCGAANSMNMLIGGRVICGVGGVGQYVGVMNFFPRLTSIQERPLYVSGMGLTWGLGTVLGPIIGGAFTDSSAGWRWSFYINLCVGGLFAPVYLFLLPSLSPQPAEKTLAERLRHMDFLGTFLLMGAFVAGVIGLNFGGVMYPWDAPGIIVALVLGGVGFIAFGIQQTYCILTTPETRLFPVELVSWKNPLLTSVFICGCCTGVGVTVPTYIIPLYFQFTASDGSLDSGVRLLPFVCLLVFACVGGGFTISKVGYYTPWYILGGALTLVGSALMYTVDSTTSVSAVYGYTAILGLGAGMYLQLGHSVAQAKVTPAQMPAAVAFTTTAQLNGLTFALVLAQCVFLNEAVKSMLSLPTIKNYRLTVFSTGIGWVLPDAPHSELVDAISGTGSTFVADLDQATQEKVIEAIVTAMDKTYILCIVAGVVTLLLSFTMKWERLFMTASAAA
ncbi:putative mfs drug efflux protein [Neofusicoccum parvum UCRNP2]|uniref:Putative mfs drug efflux protein n=1 Tax=Botryosphaeria parva (strain UCR-NP2) TaxID=1287680 RepID=R1EDJ7_BOTPV|nr:putative mfs drug efflux protein [Neofusicoccum parvum UCRNP2]